MTAPDLRPLLQAIKAAVYKNVRYPERTRRNDEQGRVRVHFKYVPGSKQMQDIEIAESSGFERLDRAALAAVQGMSAADAIPGRFAKQDWDVGVPVLFVLKD